MFFRNPATQLTSLHYNSGCFSHCSFVDFVFDDKNYPCTRMQSFFECIPRRTYSESIFNFQDAYTPVSAVFEPTALPQILKNV